MKKGIFVSATSTAIGKTVFSALLMRFLLKQGLKVAYYKPIQTGATLETDTILSSPDCRFVSQFLQGFSNFSIACTYCFQKPASPHYAAAGEGKKIDLEKIQQHYRQLENSHDRIVTEGAGGLYVPIDDHTLMADIPRRLQQNTLLVASAGLGTINHTGLSVDWARSRGLNPRAIILISASADHFTDIETDNGSTLKNWTGISSIYLMKALTEIDTDNPPSGSSQWEDPDFFHPRLIQEWWDE